MRNGIHILLATLLIMASVCDLQVQAAALSHGVEVHLVHRVRRSMLWRWITQRPVGSSCRDHSECGTNYCRESICSFQVFSS
ncbi:liver-expressed antimicrobial peptide 2-like [Polypterus senegalus]|uniref:liver-expressed antimicrobial peptide 2-like n=1 Tax=Polypterus senegalus TaxID=55291 RepID=UPI001964C656|nr:liver-expressed antimicrobial peptide 2-like [Polypterus senegalus]